MVGIAPMITIQANIIIANFYLRAANYYCIYLIFCYCLIILNNLVIDLYLLLDFKIHG